MEEVEETILKEQCRTCLESSETMINMFEDTKTAYKLALCCGLDILDLPSLPSKICKKCADILNVSYGFRVLCHRSQEYLRSRMVPDSKSKLTTPNEFDIPELKLEDQSKNFEQDEQEYKDEIEIYSIQGDEEIGNYESASEEQTENDKEDGTEKQSCELVANENSDKDKEDDNEANTKRPKKAFTARKPKKSKPPITLMCSMCGNIFKNRATFSYHMKHHKKDKKYECEICSKRFMQTCELQAHMRVHTGEKPFACKYCERKFRDRSGVTRHERTHTNERPYGCNICGAHFSYTATLNIHQRTHTGEKPYRCDICDRGFAEAHKMKAHLATNRHAEMVKKKASAQEC